MNPNGNRRVEGDGKGRQGGRKKGTPNKITKEKRELIAAFIECKWDEFEKAFNEIDDPAKKCQIMIDLLPFALPKMASIEYKDKSKPKTLQDELDEISGEKTRK